MRTISLKSRVLEHIENTRDWLERAEDGYQNGTPLQGELNLNLAQAELKKAWEESRKLHTQSEAEVIPFPIQAAEPTLQEAKLTVQGRGWRKQFAGIQHTSGLVAAIVLVMLVNAAIWLGQPEQSQLVIYSTPEEAAPAQSEVQELTVEGQAPVQKRQVSVEPKTILVDAASPQPSKVIVKTVEKPVNQKAYTGMPLHFNLNNVPLNRNPEKEVKTESLAREQANQTTDGNHFALAPRTLTSVGKVANKWATENKATGITASAEIRLPKNARSIRSEEVVNLNSGQVQQTTPLSVGVSKPAMVMSSNQVSQEVALVNYDLDSLINMAKKVLTTKR